MQINSRRTTKGFTLIELLVVILILGILAALIVPKLFGHQSDAKIAKAKTDISELSGALDRFRLDADRYPTDQEGFSVLLVQPSDVTNWKGPYIQKLPQDPWNHDYIYHNLGSNQVQISSTQHSDGSPDISNLDTTTTQ